MKPAPRAPAPAVRQLVLVGGGHAHVEVLRRFAMQPLPGLRLTLVSPDLDTPYSGMFPGLIAGHYSRDEVHIDLDGLCRRAGARLVRAAAAGLDPETRQVELQDRPALGYDLLSLNVGSTPDLSAIEGAQRVGWAVKPWGRFLHEWSAMLERRRRGEPVPTRLWVVGGGAGGVELALAIRAALASQDRRAPNPLPPIGIGLLSAEGEVGTGLATGARRLLRRELVAKAIDVRTGVAVRAANAHSLVLADGSSLACDLAIWVTGAAAPAWLDCSGIVLDERGFVAVDETLRSVSHPRVFAAGDAATLLSHPRPKSGVFAVRQGPILADNLRRALLGLPLPGHRPQRAYLSLVSTGDGRAIASRGRWALAGRSLWWLKDRIDRRFMARYVPPPLPDTARPTGLLALPDALAIAGTGMRCGGCAAKLAAEPLARALARLPSGSHGAVPQLAPAGTDDAAIIGAPDGRLQLHSIDQLSGLALEPFTLGEIAALHALNDIWAKGGEPQTALALVTLPLATGRLMEEDLVQLLAGARRVFDAAGVVLSGGHSAEGEELAAGFAVSGWTTTARLWRKGPPACGEALLLTKPLGTGVVLAARMRNLASPTALAAAIASMRQSNGPAVPILRAYAVRCCTDVSGFGLLGHLAEMVQGDAALAVEFALPELPGLPGARELAGEGVVSSLAAANRRASGRVTRPGQEIADPLAVDPQTSGGLLASLPAALAEPCAAALRQAGFDAAVIGRVVPRP